MGFKFNSAVELDFDGVKFRVDNVTEFGTKLAKHGQDMQELSALMDRDDINAADKIIDFMYKIFDDLFGVDASTKIFSSHGRNMYDCIDAFAYVCEEIQAFQAQKNEHYGKYSPNRAVRRKK